jgi:rSAM/selenodomain-associated transferase 2
VIIGSDIPDITADILIDAFKALNQNDLVLGPASDGGYYLIGVNRRTFGHWHSQIFCDINWGTEQVLPQTLKIADDLKLSYRLLRTLKDIDRPKDLGVWYQAIGRFPNPNSLKPISVIIPTLNEAKAIEHTVLNLNKNGQTEVIVVDGGSHDETANIAKSAGAKIMTSVTSKAKQMNVGAAEATGDILLFLHADTRLPENSVNCVRAALHRDGVSAGAFSLGIDAEGVGLRIVEKVANWRSRVFQMPYGDQALFVHRRIFDSVGGYPDYPIMEDFEFVRRLKRMGKIAILPESVKTSPRRWQQLGIVKTWLLNQMIILAYYCGISPKRLSKWYNREKGTF